MRWITPLVATVLLAGWLLVGSLSGLFGLPLPALGPFFNPGHGFWQNTGEGARTQELNIHLEDERARGEIHFDDRGVPHLIAGNQINAVWLQGYVHAYDRLWQMDISTRSTEGTLAEILGPTLVSRDTDRVRNGFREMARRMIETMQRDFPEDYAIFEAYCAGINAYLDQLEPEDYPLEYKLLGHTPQRWSPYRIALLVKGMSASLSWGYDDARATATREALGEEQFDFLYPERFPNPSPVVPGPEPGVTELGLFSGMRMAPALRRPNWTAIDSTAFGHIPYDPDNGSNNWAVGPGHSNTRRPLLANDPHLPLSYPSIWYESQITYPGCNARGVGLAGAPGLMIGFNPDVAWGETNVGQDVTDWYRIAWTDSTRTAYRVAGEERTTEWRTDTLHVKGEDDVVVRTPWTVFGPVPYDAGPYAGLAMQWLAGVNPGKDRRPHTIIRVFLDLMESKNYGDYVAALEGYVDPAQNFIFAAKDGDIAIRPNGFFPLREPGQGRFIQAGDSSANNWPGWIPFADRPVHYNPARGYVSSANQVTTGPNYPYYYLGRFDEYRGRYINRVLERQPTMNQRRMKELQLDAYSLLAEELTPFLLARINRQALTEEGSRVLRVLSEWDYRYTGASRAPTLFDIWRNKLYRLTFDEFYVSDDLLRPEWWKLNRLLEEDPNNAIFDIDSTASFRETGAILVQRSFEETLEELNGALPATWAEYRDARINHLGNIPGLGSARIMTDGARGTPRVVDDGMGASWRMVVELGDEPRGWGALPGGASGNPGSEFYDNGFEEWAEGRYHELTLARKPIEPIGSWIFE